MIQICLNGVTQSMPLVGPSGWIWWWDIILMTRNTTHVLQTFVIGTSSELSKYNPWTISFNFFFYLVEMQALGVPSQTYLIRNVGWGPEVYMYANPPKILLYSAVCRLLTVWLLSNLQFSLFLLETSKKSTVPGLVAYAYYDFRRKM